MMAALAGTIAAGCSTPSLRPVVASKILPSPVVSQDEEVLDPALLKSALGEGEGQPYKVGPGDTLLVAVYNHPELAVATYAGAIAAHGARTARSSFR
jgi:protein involved in polysaccharide export with SLBB domain